MKKKVKLYLAGGLFNAGERLHNLYLEKHLRALGYETVLPQRRANRFFKDGKFDVDGIVQDCLCSCMTSENLYVGSADGADADSGGSIEYGIAITSTQAAVVYRTDFRTAEDRELGLNAMFKVCGTYFVYEPCFFTKLGEVDAYYRKLARAIHKAVASAQKLR